MEKLKMHSPDLTQDNIAKIRQLFPGCVTESRDEKTGELRLAVDFDQLKQELSDHIVEGSQERYRLDWPGKRQALLTANAPIAKTLRPCREESVNFDTTQNLFIEGDNLDALKLLQETYLGKVKMIYIDPPYNTGNDFVYKDDFRESSDEYFQRSNQKDEDKNQLVANKESNGKFHSDWLSMMMPRLKIAYSLLSPNGILYISIDDNEQSNLKRLCDEIFGSSNFLGTFVWKRRASSALAERLISTDHEYIVAYHAGEFSTNGIAKDFTSYSNPDNDPRGEWVAGDLTVGMGKDLRPNQFYTIEDPETGKCYNPNPNRVWAYIPESMAALIKEKRILFPEDTTRRPMLKRFKDELKSAVNPVSTWLNNVGLNTEGTKEMQELFGQTPFDYSKPSSLIKFLIQTSTTDGDIVLDFFAGSATTASSALQLNAKTGINRSFIMIQVPEQTHRSEFRTIAEISKERIRRAGRTVLGVHAHPDWSGDVGFRVLKVDSSNMKDVFYNPDAIDASDLVEMVDNIKGDRTGEDLLFQVMVDWAVDLMLPIRKETLLGKTVFFVDENALVACFEKFITEDLVTEIAKYQPLRMVFLDNGFADNDVKINAEQIFKQLSPSTEVKVI